MLGVFGKCFDRGRLHFIDELGLGPDTAFLIEMPGPITPSSTSKRSSLPRAYRVAVRPAERGSRRR